MGRLTGVDDGATVEQDAQRKVEAAYLHSPVVNSIVSRAVLMGYNGHRRNAALVYHLIDHIERLEKQILDSEMRRSSAIWPVRESETNE